MKLKDLQDIANILRRDSIIATTAAGSGHPTSCMSAAEIMSVLFFNEMSYDVKNPNNPDNDEFILSKGHAAPILYASLFHSGCTKNDLKNLRKFKSPLEGHPMPRSLRWIKVATGSLGQGLSVGIGMALASKIQKRKFKTYVLIGDSEVTEGSIYEALQLGLHYKLNNLVAIIDVNRLGQRGETMVGHDIKEYKKRFSSFGWTTITIDGHNIKQILNAFKKANSSKNPTIIIAKTFKGKGVNFLENKEGWHGKSVPEEQLQEALDQIPNPNLPKINIKKPKSLSRTLTQKRTKLKSNNYEIGEEVATRSAYGSALANLAQSDSLVLVVDAEVSNSTKSAEVKKKTPKQFIETYIAEQDMIGIALGLSKKGFNVFASTFAAFLSRAHDQIRMAALSSASFTVSGSHVGVSIGEDGASQMGLEDIAIFRDLQNSIIFYPSDAVSTEKLTNLSSKIKEGIKYLRTTRPKTPTIYKNSETFKVGDFKIPKNQKKSKVVLVGSGITLHESLKAYNILKKNKINTSVVDLYCIKPFNSKKFIKFVKKHGKKIIISEDHFREGGIGEMLAEEIANSGIKIKHLYVKGIPHSGKAKELLKQHKIDSSAIVKAVKGF